jgi:ectoine hydroxylase-related dioxygenase (phytanoyl-CoA dioxygenase family)
MSGFYFLEVPENSCKACFHDPNRGKLQIALPEKDESKISYASTTACYDVNPGDLIIFNSWLPHSFTPNKSDQPFKFIHFNTVVDHIHTPPPPATHVI